MSLQNNATPHTAWDPTLHAKRTRCEVYTRVMGYYRPVQEFNTAKKSEYYSRTCFNEDATFNSSFNKQYTSTC